MTTDIFFAIPGSRILASFWPMTYFCGVDSGNSNTANDHQDIPARHIVTVRLNTLLERRYGTRYTLEVRYPLFFNMSVEDQISAERILTRDEPI
jgi:hypothetical protein